LTGPQIHPWYQRFELLRLCKKEGLTVQAYAAIAQNKHAQDTELLAMAARYDISTAQVLLRYSLQKGYVPVIKATNLNHLLSNKRAECFVLSEEDMLMLDSKHRGIEGAICMCPRHCSVSSANPSSPMACNNP
jgi:diketogulonate reductase-like aldo/keto reductase